MNATPPVQPLTHEWQLGPSLNESVREGNREQFRLLLAMLSEDARDQPQFQKLQQKPIPSAELRAQFELPPPQNLYATPDELSDGEGAKLAQAEDVMGLLLKNCLHPEPFTAPQVIGPGAEVMGTLSPLQQHKHRVALGLEDKAEHGLSWHQADQALLNMLNQQQLVA